MGHKMQLRAQVCQWTLPQKAQGVDASDPHTPMVSGGFMWRIRFNGIAHGSCC